MSFQKVRDFLIGCVVAVASLVEENGLFVLCDTNIIDGLHDETENQKSDDNPTRSENCHQHFMIRNVFHDVLSFAFGSVYA